MVSSKFSFWNVYFVYALLLGIFVGGGYLVLHPQNQFKTKLGFTTNGTVVGLVLMGLAIYLIYLLLKQTRQLIVEQEGITVKTVFSTQFIARADIKAIHLTGRRNLGLLSNHRLTNTIIIELATGEQLAIADFFYRNNPALKSVLYSYTGQQPIASNSGSLPAAGPVELTSMKRYAGNYILSFNGFYLLLVTALCIFCGVVTVHSDKSAVTHRAGFLFAACIAVFLFWGSLVFAICNQLHYFLLSDKYLVVRNHIFGWKKKVFALNTILEVLIEMPYRRSTTMTITLTDFRRKKYAAGSLRKETWQQLEQDLGARGIPVTDEVH